MFLLIFCILFPFLCLSQFSVTNFFTNYFLLFLQKIKAKALYDNIAETVDELAFRKGDILTVIEQNTDSLEGWWLCTLRGRQVSNKIILEFCWVIFRFQNLNNSCMHECSKLSKTPK